MPDLDARGWRPEAGGQRLEARGWRPEAGGQIWRPETWGLEAGGKRLGARSKMLE